MRRFRGLVFDMSFGGGVNVETGETDAAAVYSMGQAIGEFALKFLLLAGMCSLILLLTTGIGSNVAGTIVAVLCGAGFTGLAYSGISSAINKLFKFEDEFDLTRYMPDSLYRTDLVHEGAVGRAIVAAIVTIVVLMTITTRLYDKKDIK